MTVLNRTPISTNFLQPTKYILAFNRLPTVQYFCQKANIPGVSIDSATFPTPLLDVPIAGTKLNYDEFTVSFLVDEYITSWTELYKWLLAMGSPKSLEDRVNYNTLQNSNTSKVSYYSDANLTVMTALNNPAVRINFHRMYPVSLTGIDFDTELSADTIITATATFRYEYFEITSA